MCSEYLLSVRGGAGGDAIIGRACQDLRCQLFCQCGTDLPFFRQYDSCEVSAIGRKLGSMEVEPLPRSPQARVDLQDADSDLLGGSCVALSSDNSSSFYRQTRSDNYTLFWSCSLYVVWIHWEVSWKLDPCRIICLLKERDCNKWIRLPEPVTPRQELDQNSLHGSWQVQPSKPWGPLLWWLSCDELQRAGAPRQASCELMVAASLPTWDTAILCYLCTRVCLHTRCAGPWAGTGQAALTFATETKEMLLCVFLLTLLWWFLWVISLK